MIPILAAMEWIIPVVAFTVWILTVLAKDKPAVPGQKAPNAPGRPGLDLGNELQKFLDEAKRRAQKAEPIREVRPQPVAKVVPVARVVQAAPASREGQGKKRKAASKPIRPQASISFAQAFPEVLPEVVALALPEVVAHKPMAEYTESKVKARTTAPAVRTALGLLKDQQSIRTAFILCEILSPPRCKTGPHRV